MCGLRCKACNTKLSFFDVNVNKSDTLPEPEDLCSLCRGYAYMEEWPFSYAFEELTEKLVNVDKESIDEYY